MKRSIRKPRESSEADESEARSPVRAADGIQQPTLQLPIVAIVGRPNVGKSSLFNALSGERVAIVDEIPGVTRDRVSQIIAYGDVTMELLDTGGIGIVDRDDLGDHVDRQISAAVARANVILFLTDVRDGVTSLDRDVAKRLRERSKEIPVFLVVNKVDTGRQMGGVTEFFALGMGDPVPVSALHRRGMTDLLEQVIPKLWPTGEVDPRPVMGLAVVGRQNVGKSTFVNAIAREERVIVSEVPGTTRDAVDVHFEKDGRRFVVIDTAGIKQISRAKSSIEVYSQFRTESAIRRANVVLFLLDASQDITRSDKRIGSLIATESKVCVVVANKWDLVRKDVTTEAFGEYLTQAMPGLRYAPVIFTTAKDARNIQATVDLAQNLYKRSLRRVGTGELNRILGAILEHHRPRSRGKRVPKLYYGTQIESAPPTFVLFVNEPDYFPPDYRRYIESALRDVLKLDEIPLKLHFRGRAEGADPEKDQ